jgi:hypothetical protein
MDRAADFFVSYSSSDRAWAEWIAWQLEQAGYLVVIQAWDFEPGDNHVARMRDGLEQADPTLSWANVPPVLARLWSRSSCYMHPPRVDPVFDGTIRASSPSRRHQAAPPEAAGRPCSSSRYGFLGRGAVQDPDERRSSDSNATGQSCERHRRTTGQSGRIPTRDVLPSVQLAPNADN